MRNRKILAAVHLYPPKHLCGGEMYLHNMLKFLQSKGHEVRVLLLNAKHYGIERIYTFDGVEVFPSERDIITSCVEWCDMMVTHLDYTSWVIGIASVYHKPVMHLVHNSYVNHAIVEADREQFIVYNSEWCKKAIGYKHEGIVLHPPVDYRKWKSDVDHSKNEYITLVNLDDNKGGKILQQLAAKMPGRKFLGVIGSYSEPANIGQYTNQPANVKVIAKTTKMKEDVYDVSRIVIMPSRYESWGMVATEAASSGIPVICSPTPGLKENLGKAGIFVERDDLKGWENAIHKLDNPEVYKKQSAAVRKRAEELDPNKEMEALATLIQERVRFIFSQSRAAGVSTPAKL